MTEAVQNTDDRRQARGAWYKALGILATPQAGFTIIRRHTPWLGVLFLLIASAASLALVSVELNLRGVRGDLAGRFEPEQVDAMMAPLTEAAAAALADAD